MTNIVQNTTHRLIYTAICFFPKESGKKPHKYRNIRNLDKFLDFAFKMGFAYVNLYSKETRAYLGRKWLTEASK